MQDDPDAILAISQAHIQAWLSGLYGPSEPKLEDYGFLYRKRAWTMPTYIEGKLTLAAENDPRPHLQLSIYVLHAGHALDVLVSDVWIAGLIEYGVSVKWAGWHLDTGNDDDPVILLRPGVHARVEEMWVK